LREGRGINDLLALLLIFIVGEKPRPPLRLQSQKGFYLCQNFRPLGRLEFPQGGLLGGVLVIVLTVAEAADRRCGLGGPQNLGQIVGDLNDLSLDRPDAQDQMIPGDAQVKIESPFRVGRLGFDALEVRSPSVFVDREVKFYR